ncbi:hypothetical protein J6590_089872 [Homalodisca vitripennis]|nr:hypothetical protein J6590_089872 [Homalodisca vitripennis]
MFQRHVYHMFCSGSLIVSRLLRVYNRWAPFITTISIYNFNIQSCLAYVIIQVVSRHDNTDGEYVVTSPIFQRVVDCLTPAQSL